MSKSIISILVVTFTYACISEHIQSTTSPTILHIDSLNCSIHENQDWLPVQFFSLKERLEINATDGVITSFNTSIPTAEYQALYDIYESAGGLNWQFLLNGAYHFANWNFAEFSDPCGDSWNGVACSCLDGDFCHISELSLDGNHMYGLSGIIPESLGDLTELTILDLSNGLQLIGTIPPL